MLKPHPLVALIFNLTLVVCICFSLPVSRFSVRAQQSSAVTLSDTARGIQLYQQGKIKETIEVLRSAVKANKNDAEAWHYLGLALNRADKTKEARGAFENAAKLRPDFAASRVGLAYTLLLLGKSGEAEREAERALGIDALNVEAHYIVGVARLREGDYEKALRQAETALKIKNNFAQAYLLRSQALVSISATNLPVRQGASGVEEEDEQATEQARARQRQQYQQAAESLEKYLQLNPSAGNAAQLREQLEALRIYSGIEKTSNEPTTILSARSVTRRARVLTKPATEFTDAARQANISGMVRLRAVLSSDGQVKYILVLKPLSHGLTEAAIAASRKIKFEPAMKDGRPVSQFVILEYVFHTGR